MKADFHIHTNHSLDGELSVDDIVHLAISERLSAISITDHNLVTALPGAMSSDTKGVKIIPGIEIDCNYKGTDLHVLGYHINWQSSDFKMLEEEVAAKIMNAFNQMIDNLHSLGIDADADEVLRKAKGILPSGELIAEVLLENPRYSGLALLDPYRPGGTRSDMPLINFYLDFFAQGKPAYVKIPYMKYEEAIDLIRQNKGIPVIAHPGLNFRGKEDVVYELIAKGAEGIEIFNNYHSKEQISFLADMAVSLKVMLTCGSDFHGKTKPLIRPGMYTIVKQYEETVNDCMYKLGY